MAIARAQAQKPGQDNLTWGTFVHPHRAKGGVETHFTVADVPVPTPKKRPAAPKTAAKPAPAKAATAKPAAAKKEAAPKAAAKKPAAKKSE
jgi:hypothetical protein